VAVRRRRSPLTAASGSTHTAYQGSSHAVAHNSAIVLQPAATRQSAPRTVRHSAYASTATNAATYRWRHQPGVPLRPTSRAVSAGRLWVATCCCSSLRVSRKPNACTPNPSTPTSATATSARPARSATRVRSRPLAPAATRNGSASPAVSLTPTPAASAPAPARRPEPALRAEAVSANVAASASITSVSLCAPPTHNTSVTGFSPTNAAAHRPECPRRVAARASSATAARQLSTAIVLNAHSAPATPSGTSA
jgi:hypothetical protein